MEYEQLTFADVRVNQIRSKLSTLENFRKTSDALHRRPTEAVRALARGLENFVREVEGESHQNEKVDKWIRKSREYLNQHNLVESDRE